ncbi:DUF1559 domain-containing protein, partial [bacterium]
PEVVGVTAIVGLTTAFLLPIFGHGKLAAARARCQTNLKQIGETIDLYASDWDATFPRTTIESASGGLGPHWAVLIQPYLKSSDVFVCLGDNQPVPAEYHRFSRKDLLPHLSYINNYNVIPAHDFYPVHGADIDRPQSLILLTERRSLLATGKRLKSWKGTSGFTPGQPCQGHPYRPIDFAFAQRKLRTAKSDKELLITRVQWAAHGEGSNYLYLDGHVAARTLGQTLKADDYQWGDRFYPVNMKHARCE